MIYGKILSFGVTEYFLNLLIHLCKSLTLLPYLHSQLSTNLLFILSYLAFDLLRFGF